MGPIVAKDIVVKFEPVPLLRQRSLASYQVSFDGSPEPELLHIITSGFENRYFCFYENAYETEPQMTGIVQLTKEEIKKRFDIDII